MIVIVPMWMLCLPKDILIEIGDPLSCEGNSISMIFWFGQFDRCLQRSEEDKIADRLYILGVHFRIRHCQYVTKITSLRTSPEFLTTLIDRFESSKVSRNRLISFQRRI
ncbi:hypothetical protein PsorP6_014711 [Peronosclerospora sorghi]|uniref:Uncharacterized protein n=1 Tax=Peronosclerospora sorghi TaxID=230839 RepID=A0ACC0VTT6_9STRA|nr:hypothetical protein PsorP6_014711 [Peronosclerospora sorghi]